MLMSVLLVVEQTGFAQMAQQIGMPQYLRTIAPVADQFRPVHLRAITPDESLSTFEVSLDQGDAKQLSDSQLQDAATQLTKYFLIGLRLPNSMFWVNLRPDAPDQIIDPYLEKTDVGRILLEADLQLKKDLARFTDPDTKEGKEYWDKLYQKAEALFGAEDIEIPTVMRPWIVPGEIILGEAENTAYVYKAALKVMLEQDYLKDVQPALFSDPRLKELNEYSSALVRALIVPRLTREINASKRYAALRQVHYSLILAQWFKEKHASSGNIDQKDLTGLTSAQRWNKASYFNTYKKSVSQGEYRKEKNVSTQTGITVRTYTSGGIAVGSASSDPAFIVNGVPGQGSLVKRSVSTPRPRKLDGGNSVTAQDKIRDGGLEQAVVTQFNRNPPREIFDTEIAYLPTKQITKDMLPADYPTWQGHRDPLPLDVPRSIEAIPRVDIEPLRHDDDFVIPASLQDNGLNALVLVGRMRQTGYPVVIKGYETNGGRLLRDYQGGYVADMLGIGPRVHGIYMDKENNPWMVMDIVQGDFTEAAPEYISTTTISDYMELYERLSANNIYPVWDFQYYVSRTGHVWVIDQGSLVGTKTEWKEIFTDQYLTELLKFISLSRDREHCLRFTFTALSERTPALVDQFWQIASETFPDILRAGEMLNMVDPAKFANQRDGGGEKKVAGVDMRSLRSSRRATGRARGMSKPAAAVSADILKKQWEAMREDIAAGSIPYAAFREYVSQCSLQGAQEELFEALEYVAAVLRMEENLSVATPPEMREILMALG